MATNPRLSATEAYLLRALPHYDARHALKIGFMELTAQGVLRLETEGRRGLLHTRHIPHLRVADGAPADLPPIALSLVDLVRAASPEGLVTDVLGRAETAYGRGLARFVQNYVGPALVARGLAEACRHRVLGLIPYDTFARTPAGDAEKARLDAMIEDARSIPQQLDRAPDGALEVIAALGSAIVLVDELRPHYDRLSRAMRSRDADASVSIDGLDWASGDVHAGCLDFGNLDFGCFDAGVFDSFDAEFNGDSGGSASR